MPISPPRRNPYPRPPPAGALRTFYRPPFPRGPKPLSLPDALLWTANWVQCPKPPPAGAIMAADRKSASGAPRRARRRERELRL